MGGLRCRSCLVPVLFAWRLSVRWGLVAGAPRSRWRRPWSGRPRSPRAPARARSRSATAARTRASPGRRSRASAPEAAPGTHASPPAALWAACRGPACRTKHHGVADHGQGGISRDRAVPSAGRELSQAPRSSPTIPHRSRTTPRSWCSMTRRIPRPRYRSTACRDRWRWTTRGESFLRPPDPFWRSLC